jgi:Transposase DDE domain
MRDPETFLIEVYVLFTDDLEPTLPPAHPRPGTALTRGEVVSLALLAQWGRFPSERDFYRYAETHLRGLFPCLPTRSQFNRAVRREQETLTQVALHLAQWLEPEPPSYEILDSTGVPVRNRRRPGHGWLPDVADVGYSPRLGMYEGFHLRLCSAPDGVVTGWGVGPASASDRALAETLLAVRQHPDPGLSSVGQAGSGWYVADSGFASERRAAFWQEAYEATVVAPPQSGTARARHWSPDWRSWLARRRQAVEHVIERVQDWCGLTRERPHNLTGFQARLAAKMALHNVCIWLARRDRLPALSLVEVLAW